MIRSNEHYAGLPGAYLFATVAARVRAHREQHPALPVISLGIGDVTRPLPPAVITALHSAVDEMASSASFKGYGPEQGYDFLREAIAAHDYRAHGVQMDAADIFISDGSKCDVANIQELFSLSCRVAVTDPVYPVYVDSNAMAGRAGEPGPDGWSRLVYLPCTRENDFVPDFPKTRPDMIYLCYPNNPTGTVLSRAALQGWVDYARREGCVILYDSAYEAFITEPDVPHSIYEIDGAREVAVEFRSYSKTAGFTGLRCAYVVVPKELRVSDGKGGKVDLHHFWNRRQCTKYNGCPYIVQRAAAAIYSDEGKKQVRAVIEAYLDNARLISDAVRGMGLDVFGGINAPYIWVSVSDGMTSWDFFDLLLEKAHIVGTPGSGFGKNGEGFFRLTAFGSPEATREAMDRLRALLA